jgi:hypothetical protein
MSRSPRMTPDRSVRHKRAVKNSRTPKFHYITFPPRYGSVLRPPGKQTWPASGEAAMTGVLNDLLLFSCLTALLTGIVIAAATLLI